MLGLSRFYKVMTAAAMLSALAGAQAAPSCNGVSAEDLLDDSKTAPASGFALTERLCSATLVRRSTAIADTTDSAVIPTQKPLAITMPPPAGKTRPQAAARASAERPRRIDAAGEARIRAVAPLVAQVARRHDIDPLLLHALAHIESRHQVQAISPAGARGLMQVMPATGRDMGVVQAGALLTPEANLEASATYLKRLQQRFGNDLKLVLAAYNAGEGAVERHGRRVPPFAETQAYVRNVMAVYAELRRRLAPGVAGAAGVRT